MTSPFIFESTASEIADAFLQESAEHLLTLNSTGRQVFLAEAIVLFNLLPIDSVSGAMGKAQVIMTLQGWLDQVTEQVSA